MEPDESAEHPVDVILDELVADLAMVHDADISPEAIRNIEAALRRAYDWGRERA